MGRASSLPSGAIGGLWGGGQPNPPLPWAVPLSSRARPWHRGGSTLCTPRVTLPDLPWHRSCKRSGLAGSTEAAHTISGAAPAARKAVVSDGVSNCMRGRVGDRSRVAVGCGAAPRLPSTAVQREAGSAAPKAVLGKLGELVGSMQQRDPNVGCRQTCERLPFCSQNANRDENAMAMSHGAAALAGERGRGETGRGWHAGR